MTGLYGPCSCHNAPPWGAYTAYRIPWVGTHGCIPTPLWGYAQPTARHAAPAGLRQDQPPQHDGMGQRGALQQILPGASPWARGWDYARWTMQPYGLQHWQVAAPSAAPEPVEGTFAHPTPSTGSGIPGTAARALPGSLHPPTMTGLTGRSSTHRWASPTHASQGATGRI